VRYTLAVLVLVAGSCSPSDSNAGASTDTRGDGEPLVVYTVNYPLAFFAQRIGGESVRVEFPAPADEDPAFWSPEAETIVAYQEADLILLNGAGYAKWVERASLPASRTVDTSATLTDRLIESEAVTHTHGPAGDHSHGETAFTTWLDLTLAVEQARTISSRLSASRPQFQEDFELGFQALEAELLDLDARWRAIVVEDPDRPLLGSHPVYQYLEARLGLNLVSLHWEPGEMPDDRAWSELEGLLESHTARGMLWEGEPLPAVAERLKRLGVECFVFDPCANRPDGAHEFLDVMESNTRSLEAAFGGS